MTVSALAMQPFAFHALHDSGVTHVDDSDTLRLNLSDDFKKKEVKSVQVVTFYVTVFPCVCLCLDGPFKCI